MNTHRESAGFSLVEAVFSAVVLGIGMIGLINLHTSSMRGEVRAMEMTRAQELVRQVADYYAAEGFEVLDDAMGACGAAVAAMACGPADDLPSSDDVVNAACEFWAGRDWALDDTIDRNDAYQVGAHRMQVVWIPDGDVDKGTLLVSACGYGDNDKAVHSASASRVVVR